MLKEDKSDRVNYIHLQDDESEKLKRASQINQGDELYTSELTVDEFLNNAGYNAFTFKIIFLILGVVLIHGFQMTLFSSMIIPFKNLFQISDLGIQIIAAIFFAGVALGSIICGIFSKKWSRPLLINIYISIIFIFTIIMAFSSNYILFGLSRFIIGTFLGMTIPLSIDLLTECLPLKNRALVMTSIWCGFSIGIVLSQVIMLLVMPQLESSGVTSTIMYCSMIPLVTLIFCLIFLEDSPRNLILRNSEEEALNILERINGKSLDANSKQSLITSVKESINKEISKEFKEIFNSKFIYLSIFLGFIMILNSLNVYGPMLISSLTLKSLGQVKTTNNRQIIIDQIIINLFGIPSPILGGLICEINFLGRKNSKLIFSILAITLISIFLIFPNSYTILFGLSQAILEIVFNLTTTYSCEAYPTKIRDYALGFLYFCTRSGGIISQILFLNLNNLGIWVPYYVLIGLIAVNMILIYLLPFDTYGKPLDVDHSK